MDDKVGVTAEALQALPLELGEHQEPIVVAGTQDVAEKQDIDFDRPRRVSPEAAVGSSNPAVLGDILLGRVRIQDGRQLGGLEDAERWPPEAAADKPF